MLSTTMISRFGQIICFLIVWSLALSSYAQDSVIDSLFMVLKEHATKDTVRVKLLCQLSQNENHYSPENAKVHAEEALELAEDLNFKKGEGMAYEALSNHAYTIGEFQSAINYALKMLAIYESLSDKQRIAVAYYQIGGAYLELQDFARGASFLRKSIDYNIQAQNKLQLLRSYNRYGLYLYYTEQYDSALIIHKRGLAMREEMNDMGGIAQACNNIGIVLVDMGQYDKAIVYFRRALSIFESFQDRLRIGGVCQNLGNSYLQKGDYRQAEHYLKRALSMATAVGTLREKLGAYGFLSDLEIARGNFKKALDYQLRLQSIQDTIYNEDKARMLAQAETQYNTQKKEKTIQLLEKEKQIQSIWLYVLAIGGAAAFIIYFLQRSRTQKAKELLVVQEKLNSKLKETDLLKSRFFANISHEFRTPLSLILAPIENKINSSSILPADKEDLKLVKRNSLRLLNLVNQLLDLSKLEAGRMELQLASGHLEEFLQLLTTSFNSLAQSKELNFHRNITIEPSIVLFDSDKVEKIVTNILYNAFKFTPRGGTVSFAAAVSNDGKCLHITVCDTGQGIPEEDQPHVFSAFYQSKYAIDDAQLGTGLGLSLVSELVKLYEGTIRLNSKLNVGTTIAVELPLYTGQIANLPADQAISVSIPEIIADEEVIEVDGESEKDAQHDSILIIEDNADLQNFIAKSFGEEFTVHKAFNGEEGLKMAQELIPDLIISDVMMPKMDGIELTNRIKSDERTSHIPVVLLTAKADGLSRIEGLRKGADDYLAKPFSTEELRVRVANLIAQRKKLAARYKNMLTQPIAAPVEPTVDEKFIAKVKEVIERHLGNSQFSVEVLADEVNLSRAQLFRKCKALIDTSPSDLINDIRLQRAARMIRYKTDTLAQISYAVGFNEQSYFAKRFRKKYGLSPTEYAQIRESKS